MWIPWTRKSTKGDLQKRMPHLYWVESLIQKPLEPSPQSQDLRHRWWLLCTLSRSECWSLLFLFWWPVQDQWTVVSTSSWKSQPESRMEECHQYRSTATHSNWLLLQTPMRWNVKNVSTLCYIDTCRYQWQNERNTSSQPTSFPGLCSSLGSSSGFGRIWGILVSRVTRRIPIPVTRATTSTMCQSLMPCRNTKVHIMMWLCISGKLSSSLVSSLLSSAQFMTVPCFTHAAIIHAILTHPGRLFRRRVVEYHINTTHFCQNNSICYAVGNDIHPVLDLHVQEND